MEEGEPNQACDIGSRRSDLSESDFHIIRLSEIKNTVANSKEKRSAMKESASYPKSAPAMPQNPLLADVSDPTLAQVLRRGQVSGRPRTAA